MTSKAIRQEVYKKSVVTKIPYFKKAEVEEPGYVPFLERDRVKARDFIPKQHRDGFSYGY